MATDYENNWGPRWRVTEISQSPKPVPANIAKGDGLTFEGSGDGGPLCIIRKHNGAVWGTGCLHKTSDTAEALQSGHGTWDIVRTKKPSPALGYKLTATQRSGTGASWTAEEGG